MQAPERGADDAFLKQALEDYTVLFHVIEDLQADDSSESVSRTINFDDIGKDGSPLNTVLNGFLAASASGSVADHRSLSTLLQAGLVSRLLTLVIRCVPLVNATQDSSDPFHI